MVNIASDDDLYDQHDSGEEYLVDNIQFVQADQEESDDDLQPVPPEILEALPLNTFTQANKANFSDENKLCTICQSNYECGDKYLLLMCLHRFHNECIQQWF